MNGWLRLVQKDLKLAAREQLAVYMILAIAVMCGLTRLWLPVLSEPQLGFAVSADVPAGLVQALERHGTVLRLADGAAVEARVRGLDDVAGLRLGADGALEVVLEGGEPAALAELASWIPARWQAQAQGQPGPQIAVERLPGAPPRLFPGVAALLVLGAALGAGVITGFTVVEEREQGTLAAYRTSPLGTGAYLGAKAALAAGVMVGAGVLNALLVAGPGLPWGPVLAGLLSAVPYAWMLAALVGGGADNALAAVTVIKGLGLVASGVPLASFLVTGPWAWALAPFPNHWAFQALFKALAEQPGWERDLGLALLTGLVAAGLSALWMARRLGLGATRG